MLLPEQNITKKRQVDKNMMEFEFEDKKKYKIKRIWDSKINIKNS